MGEERLAYAPSQLPQRVLPAFSPCKTDKWDPEDRAPPMTCLLPWCVMCPYLFSEPLLGPTYVVGFPASFPRAHRELQLAIRRLISVHARQELKRHRCRRVSRSATWAARCKTIFFYILIFYNYFLRN
jgi:hypothetical protein